ncbi:hypothetical protein PoB_004557700 [Plakobranchus ocellatus]|uniref:Uncharacterized protein n=1 Tax=Plakobranchus ocellatus TaxID=259542 RepID=A0AAV4BID3_9GAST|nr:hypothetical protein PoB_004557700 [Plakobranchus ocellatus]
MYSNVWRVRIQYSHHRAQGKSNMEECAPVMPSGHTFSLGSTTACLPMVFSRLEYLEIPDGVCSSDAIGTPHSAGLYNSWPPHGLLQA